MVRIGINGFGRIGRQSLRAIHERGGGEGGGGGGSGAGLTLGGQGIKVCQEREPSAIPWGQVDVELVLESTGRFTQAEKARGHLQGGAKKVVISAPGEGEDITGNMGVNHDLYDPKKTTD